MMRRSFKRFLRWLGRCVYPPFLPLQGARHDGAERYLEDVWRDAPWYAALAHTGMALVFSFLPILTIKKFNLFFFLSTEDQERMILALMRSRIYFFRLLVYAIRGNAFVAILRDPEVRKNLPDSIPFKPAAVPAFDTTQSRKKTELDADYIVIGSGAAGATLAKELAEAGEDTLILEEGKWFRRPDFTEDLYGAIARMFRDFGVQAAKGPSIFPVLEGRCVGGSTVINGGIIHRLPESVHNEWLRDSGIAERLPFDALERHAEAIERELGVGANLSPLLPDLPVVSALNAMGWEYNAMLRNAPGCQHTGRCLQGCPSGGKLSMENSFIPKALQAGARIETGRKVLRLIMDGDTATGVRAANAEGGISSYKARKAVILASGTVQTPLILNRSGLSGPHVGLHFQCHLGIGTVGILNVPARSVEGPPQGIEIFPPDNLGVKLATQLLPPELLLARSPVIGQDLADLMRHCDRVSSWTGSVRSSAEGRVRPGLFGRASIQFAPSRRDMEGLRHAVWQLSNLLFQLGAVRVFPGIAGIASEFKHRSETDQVLSASLDPKHYFMGVGHLFGTCRMGSNPALSVVGPDFRVHGKRNLYVADGSVFPSNIGVNPQLAIMTLARHCAHNLISGRS